MPGSEKWNTTSDTGSHGKRKQRRNSSAHPNHSVGVHLKHSAFLLSHILKNYSMAEFTCQYFSFSSNIYFDNLLYIATYRFSDVVFNSCKNRVCRSAYPVSLENYSSSSSTSNSRVSPQLGQMMEPSSRVSSSKLITSPQTHSTS